MKSKSSQRRAVDRSVEVTSGLKSSRHSSHSFRPGSTIKDLLSDRLKKVSRDRREKSREESMEKYRNHPMDYINSALEMYGRLNPHNYSAWQQH